MSSDRDLEVIVDHEVPRFLVIRSYRDAVLVFGLEFTIFISNDRCARQIVKVESVPVIFLSEEAELLHLGIAHVLTARVDRAYHPLSNGVAIW